jgi:predicted membrane chloride channel (bestrophin family)
VQRATIQNSCRVLVRQWTSATTNAVATGAATAAAAAAHRREMAGRLIGFTYSWRHSCVEPVTVAPPHDHGADDVEDVAGVVNPANLHLQSIAVRVKNGVRDGLVGQFDPITLEPALGALNCAATACERLKHTPTPRQYDYFTRVGVAAFSTLLPFGLLGTLPSTDAWWTVPLTAVIAGVFIVLERVGAILDAPFANTVNDIPITAICRDIERDLLEQLGDHPLPEPTPAVAGYLW